MISFSLSDNVRESYERGEDSISIPHVRDQLFPPAKRYYYTLLLLIHSIYCRRGTELARWDRAVSFVNEKESRIVTEAVYRRGVEV